ncbi:hypothetical protein [Pseudonocardia thermophila]|uniref:hypothetical protein n=1 Tax=Pseudonocardia thermophila TaxID=1848 RepID=UPI001161543B|nr:hypothetical protein [Pseudonocardia thermophila]
MVSVITRTRARSIVPAPNSARTWSSSACSSGDLFVGHRRRDLAGVPTVTVTTFAMSTGR